MSDHQSILQSMFKALDEEQRIEFLREVWDSLSDHAKVEFLQIAQVTLASSSRDEILADQAAGLKEKTAPQPSTTFQDAKFTSIDALTAKPFTHAEPKVKTKEESLKVAMSQFERIQQEHQADQKKSFRKEFFSCLGLGVLGFLGLVIISMALRWIWLNFTG